MSEFIDPKAEFVNVVKRDAFQRFGHEGQRIVLARLSLVTLTDVKRAFMEGVIALAAEQKNPAPQWMVDRLWNESAVKAVTERALHTT